MASWSCPHLCLFDFTSRYRVMVDTGISRSLWPATTARLGHGDRTLRLLGAPTDQVRTFGTCTRRVCFGPGAAIFCVDFRLASVDIPILGADFLRNSSLVVNVRDRTLTHSPPGNRPQMTYRMPEHVPHATLLHFGHERCACAQCL